MFRIFVALVLALALRARHAAQHAARHSDRGEFGPMAYAVMVSAMVLLALAVAAWGESIADLFMAQIEGPGGGGG